jgi:hypothetical protein
VTLYLNPVTFNPLDQVTGFFICIHFNPYFLLYLQPQLPDK